MDLQNWFNFYFTETATIVARERPSIMAKPRDLSRRNLSNSSQSELINNDQQQTSHQNENKNPSSHDDHLDFSKNNGEPSQTQF